ncbi:AtzE family amidohydrolase [Oculatella sp. LEGE 06141]|uniref:AtzE family amidohydrolase n=1 Tax=Oculatella sp. LEGE 06141 TaxID=1828648 RepID=UPI001881E760|nr:AtzE family amidohydrolase [Oculatella sp. LEGE 06141]MBE9177442.1 AtzE family amidohydrolase [Oculatella sp. LEGE 06141]
MTLNLDTLDLDSLDAIATAEAVRAGVVSATTVTQAALARIAARDPAINSFTSITQAQALADAAQVDAAIAAGQDPGLLAGVPFAVKNLFDIAGLVTVAGSKINQANSPASQDATAVAALKQAGAVLVGALNMDEYAYGFTTENSHYGPCHNPYDLERVGGGSSGGSAVSVAAGLVPLTLGSDTNGSIRVPSSLCGIFGLKPTYGRLSRAGAYPFVGSLDHIGPFARSVRDIAAAFDVLQGSDANDPICTTRPPEQCLPQLSQGITGLRIAIADGYFATGGEPEVFEAVERVAQALSARERITLPETHRARAAAYIITACEGSNLHLERLRTCPQDFDPATRDRFLAGAMIPGSWYLQAQRFRRWYRDRLSECFQQADLILAPATPCTAPKIGQTTMVLDGVEVLTRPNLGLYTQPLSFVGLPVLSVPVQRANGLPIGVQIIAAPYQEATILRAAAFLEAQHVISAPIVLP